LDTANKDTAKWKDRITELAAGEGIYLNQRPLYQTIEKTSVYNLQQNIMETNLGMATIIPTNTGWLTIMALYYDRKGIASDFRQIILFVFIDILGAAALFLISSIYINKVLRPLEEGQKKQKEFIAAASHELRSPLTIIKAGISSVREDNSKSDQFLPHIERECDRMTNLINDMLLLASADARTWTFKREQVDMDTLLIESYDMFCSCYNKNNYQLALDLPEEKLHKIIGDRERIKQILTILMDNAMNYSLSGNQITIRAYNQKHCVVIEVEDHGSGIKDEEKKQIFERFYQGDKSRNDKKHFGLGLSIAKELVELHNGDIFVKDTMGGGTTFVLRLPD
jgi:signal transduction histidine kinase